MSEREGRGGLLTSMGSLIGLCLQKRSLMIVREKDEEVLKNNSKTQRLGSQCFNQRNLSLPLMTSLDVAHFIVTFS